MTHAVDPEPIGLSETEAAARRAAGQGNGVSFEASRSYLSILRDNALGSINIVIFAVGASLLSLGLILDAVVTVGIVLLNVVVAVVQEGRAKRQLDRIALLNRPKASVIRDGHERAIDPAELVVGDLLVVRPGDQIVVDGRVVGQERMDVDESLLSGESEPIAKAPGDRVYSGSFCVAGSAAYEAEQVGPDSLANEMTRDARAFRQTRTPVQREVALVLRAMIILVLAIGGPVVVDLAIRGLALLLAPTNLPLADTLNRAYRHYSVENAVRTAAVVISLVPQGLALMLTVTYALGAVRVAGKGALLQQANAIESLSHVDVLCLDKTGTLTTNRLAFQEIRPLAGAPADLDAIVGDFAASTVAPNRTIAAIAASLPGESRHARETVPFSSARKWSGFVFDGEERKGLYVLGAPDVLEPALRSGIDLATPLDEWTSAGLRVLLFARHPDSASLQGEDGQPRLPSDLVPLALIALGDELQPDAKNTIAQFERAGIRSKILSGDHPETVAALARQAGFGKDGELRTVSGLELKELDDGQLAQVAEETTIFGRITPDQKVRLIRQLRRNDHYVAMIGDGVNDVLALKQAQVGIAMHGGSQATRAVADLVLLNDSFAVLPSAFREGQRIVRGTQDLIALFLARSLAMALIIIGTGIINAAFPATPRINALPAFLVIGIPTIFLATWAKSGPTSRQLLRSVLPFALTAALTTAPVGLMLYISFLRATDDVQLAQTVLTVAATLWGLALVPFVGVAGIKPGGPRPSTVDRRPLGLSLALLALLVAIIVTPALRDFFEMASLSPLDVAIICLVVAGWFVAFRYAWRFHLVQHLLGLPIPSGP